MPPEIAAIATRALAKRPDDRYPSAAALREAIEDYLVHADSLQLTAAAQERVDQLTALLDSEGEEGGFDAAAAAAEFAFRQALHVWPGNDTARASL